MPATMKMFLKNAIVFYFHTKYKSFQSSTFLSFFKDIQHPARRHTKYFPDDDDDDGDGGDASVVVLHMVTFTLPHH